MRALLALLLLAPPAAAWEFSALPVCTLRHDDPAVSVVVTFDPSLPQPYAIAATRTSLAWPASPFFAIRFEGASALRIVTDRQTVTEGGRTLGVSDTGFGNVLDGLEFNRTAVLEAGDLALPVPLDGAAPAVRQFRDCGVAPSS